MSDELEPLGPASRLAASAFAAEHRRPEIDAATQERLLSRVVASVAVGAAVTGVAAGAKAAGSAATITAKVATVVAAAAFVVGGVTGAAIHAAVAPAVPPLPTVTAPLPPPPRPVAPQTITAPSDTVPSLPASALPSVPAGVTAPKPSAAPSSSSSSADSDLAAERTLVDRARTAIGRGQPQDALVALDAHAAKFPRGRLSEEREALAVDALARSGRPDDAKARAARFHATYPNSVFGAVVDAATAR